MTGVRRPARTNVPGGVRVVGRLASGEAAARVDLGHGADPVAALAAAGWAAESPSAATMAADGALELAYVVTEADGIPPREGDMPAGSGDDAAETHQRVAAYAVVRSVRGVLLTQFTSLTAIPGTWGLPGGGLDAGEDPVDGVHREVWEESGQRIELAGLVTMQSQHWVGRAPTGVLEDFHAVRLVYRATCADPTDPVIHDVGGTTSDARWVGREEADRLEMTSSWRGLADLAEAFSDAP
ncbi:MAG: hydrolase [Humibacillus sp.]|nr:hydrolase [Humibacillus sp.]